MRVTGQEGDEISIGCTTLEVTGSAHLEVEKVHLGRPQAWGNEKSIGEANVQDDARFVGRDVSVRNVRFRTEGQGQVDLVGVRKLGMLETREEGGPIRVQVVEP
jgi:hypothetical protein